MKKIIIVTGASSGFGKLASRELAQVGHTVYATLRDSKGRNAPAVEEAAQFAKEQGVDLRSLELDVSSQSSVNAAIEHIIEASGRLDVVVHNAGHMVLGPSEAFTADQFAELYDVNVLSTQRVNQAALPHLRKQGSGLLVWVSSTSVKGGTPPYLGPYFAAKAAMDSLAVTYALELIRFGIETSIIVPGAYSQGTNHFAHAGKPELEDVAKAYSQGPYAGIEDDLTKGMAAITPPDADVQEVAKAIVAVVDASVGKRPFRVHIDPSQDGSEVVSMVADRIHEEYLRRIGLENLLPPNAPQSL